MMNAIILFFQPVLYLLIRNPGIAMSRHELPCIGIYLHYPSQILFRGASYDKHSPCPQSYYNKRIASVSSTKQSFSKS